MNININTEIIPSKKNNNSSSTKQEHLSYCSLSSLTKHKRKMTEQMPLPKSKLEKQTLVAHASKSIAKM